MQAPFRHSPRLVAALAAALAGALCLASCGGDDKPAQPAAAPATTAVPATTAGATTAASTGKVPSEAPVRAAAQKADPAKTKQAESSAKLADGSYPIYVVGVDPDTRTLQVDVVQYFEGQAAVAAARQDNSNADIGDSDYYIRNANPRVRDLPVGRNALITVFEKANGDATEVSLAELAGDTRLYRPLYWIEVSKGTVVDMIGGRQ